MSVATDVPSDSVAAAMLQTCVSGLDVVLGGGLPDANRLMTISERAIAVGGPSSSTGGGA